MSARRLAAWAAGLSVLVCSTRAHAWDSSCTIYVDPTVDAAELDPGMRPRKCEEEAGPYAAQGRLRSDDGYNEHQQIFRAAALAAGLPPAALATWHVAVFAADKPAGSVLAASLRSVAPVDFLKAQSVQQRAFAVDELAMLPDSSYSLWDWVTGNETCPLAGYAPDGAIACHTSRSHLGMANANHFPPQADNWYMRLHDLALTRAGQCAAMRAKIPLTERARFDSFSKECEIESLAIEAVAQHYLQDVWSSGHMWERWGPSDVAEFPDWSGVPDFFKTSGERSEDYRRYLAITVGLTSGLIHGVEPLFRLLPDALCHPFPDVTFLPAPGSSKSAWLGAGDTHWGLVSMAKSGLGEQRDRLLACAATSLNDVYTKFGEAPALGPLGPTTFVAPVAPCFGQRATNQAMSHGLGLDLTTGEGGLIRLPNVRFIQLWVRGQAKFGKVGLKRLKASLVELDRLARAFAESDPTGTNVAALTAADGLSVDLLGVEPNGVYQTNPAKQLATYQDPPLPWPETLHDSKPEAPAPANSLARFFHRGHADDWCSRMTTSELEALRDEVASQRQAGAAATAVCRACTEMISRHIRMGSSDSYDTTMEPLCYYLDGKDAAIEYQPAGAGPKDAMDLAQQWCGCGGCPAVAGVVDPAYVSIKAFEVAPSTLDSGKPFNVHWALEALAGGYGTIDFLVNNNPTTEPGFISLPKGVGGSAFVRVFRDTTPQLNSAVFVDDRSRACVRDRFGSNDSMLCGTSALNVLVPYNAPAFGILNACVPCSLSAATTCDTRSVPLVFPSPPPSGG